MAKALRKTQARLQARQALAKSGDGRRRPGSENRHKSVPHAERRKRR